MVHMSSETKRDTTKWDGSSQEGGNNKREQEITVLSVELMNSQRLSAIYGHTASVKKPRWACQDVAASTVAEYGGTMVNLQNNVAMASYADPNEAIKSAIRMSTILNKQNSELPEEQRIDFAISINQGKGIIENDRIYGPVVNRLTKMTHMYGQKNKIYISENVYVAVKDLEGTEYRPVGAISDGFSRKFNIYEVLWKDNVNLEAHESILISQFQHRYALIEGVHEPCFYCGSRKHLVSHCPSKHMPEITQAFDKLRHLSVRQINALFSDSIARGLDEVRHRWENTEDVPDAYFNAYYAFYDIKRVYQLRFFRVIMGYRGNDWHMATKMNVESNGEALWIAIDHLRTGNLVQAESLLQKLNEENPNRFIVNMAMGYLNVEKGYYTYALDSFNNAYKNTETKPRKILALLLMCRINDLYLKDIRAAGEQIGLIRMLERDCPEAIYQDIVMRMRYEKDSEAIPQLIRLIKGRHEYYLTALIDPEFAGCQAKINKELHALLTHAEENAVSALKETENRLNSLKSWFGEDNQNARDLHETLSKTRELYASDSYFGYLDVSCKSASITADYNRLERESREKIKDFVNNLHHQIRQFSGYFGEGKKSAFANMLDNLKEEAVSFGKDLNLSISYKNAMMRHDELSKQLLVIQVAVDKLKKRKANTSFVIGLLTKALLFLIVAASLGLLILFIIDVG
ncbi:MAG: hypothetical protein C0399_00430 [Syntrophus sp. (in: bacteria)]|nr:hypothetical protein [Syntrophus sp. (in: bacteria)]